MNRTTSISFILSLCLSLLAPSSLAKPPKYNGKVALFGNLHAHSNLSDDVHKPSDEYSPLSAYKYADEHGIDFLALSDHHKATDAPGRAWMGAQEYIHQLYNVAMFYNESRKGKFVAIPAIEWGNTKTGNHINVFGADRLPPDSILNEDYDDLVAWAATNAEFAQYNHPYAYNKARGKKQVGNYGRDLYDSTEAFSAAAEPTVKTMTIIASVYRGHISGPDKHSEDKVHRSVHKKAFKKYKQFLNEGFKLSPSANQDTHWKNWGTVTAARTGVWADSFTYDGLMSGFKARRVFATEDDELALAAQVEVGGKRYWMGEEVPLSSDEQDVTLIVNITQGKGSDGDSSKEGPYSVSIYRDSNGIGGAQASEAFTVSGVVADEDHEIPLSVRNGEYFFVEVTEENGSDNPDGDGVDELNNATGDDVADGKRDNLNDSAWSSPFWFTADADTPTFVWSKNSKLYHQHFCWAAKRIGQANKVESSTAPEGKKKHNCK